MARYAVGDLQGFLSPLLRLLEQVNFQPDSDELWLVGDLVNRGSEDAETLRFLMSLPHAKAVLGNHDLHLLAVAHGSRSPNRKDTIQAILDAPDRDELLHWLQHRPLLVRDDETRQVMTHAGIPPCWTVDEASEHAREVEAVLRHPRASRDYFRQMYGNSPDRWHEDLTGPDRWRVVTNYFTRMRYLGPDSQLDFAHKSPPTEAPDGLAPWFETRADDGWQVLFGHWAALMGATGQVNRLGLDTGYGWDGWLSMIDMDDPNRLFQTNQAGVVHQGGWHTLYSGHTGKA